MSAEVVNALDQRAHQLDAEADNASASENTAQGRAHPSVLRFIAQEFRTLALMVQGRDPAREEADRLARESVGGADGLRVQRTDESGQAVAPPPDAGQQAAMPQSGAQESQPGPSYPQPGQ